MTLSAKEKVERIRQVYYDPKMGPRDYSKGYYPLSGETASKPDAPSIKETNLLPNI